ncbi:MAG: hypothetical protein HYX74_03365 [Acidobacteria bacterium]|nr:hypothetical protein [Acidobacteriota bacterium]
MSRNSLITLLLLLGIATTPAAAQQGAGRGQASDVPEAPEGQLSGGITYTHELSQTSLWPGDRFHYTIALKVPEGVKISLDDFDRKAVNFKPFSLTDTHRVTEELADSSIRYQFEYLLANYEIGNRTLEIPRVIFHSQKTADAGTREPTSTELQIPPLPIAVRSTLYQPAKQSWIQESLALDYTANRAWMAPVGLGIAGLLISAIPLLVWAWNQVPQWRSRERKVSQKQFLRQCTRSLDMLGKGFDKNSEEVKRQYQLLEGVAHRYVHYFWNVDAEGLTGKELVASLQKMNVPPKQRDLLTTIVDHGQTCRYSRTNGGQWTTVFQQDLREMRNALPSKR